VGSFLYIGVSFLLCHVEIMNIFTVKVVELRFQCCNVLSLGQGDQQPVE
jgi:hypothetical protein